MIERCIGINDKVVLAMVVLSYRFVSLIRGTICAIFKDSIEIIILPLPKIFIINSMSTLSQISIVKRTVSSIYEMLKNKYVEQQKSKPKFDHI